MSNIVELQTPLVINPTPKTAVSIALEVRNIVLFTSAEVLVLFFDGNNELVDSRVVFISGEDYTSWTNDDQSLINIVKTNLGIS